MARGGDEEVFRKNLHLLETAAAGIEVLRTGVYHEMAQFSHKKSGSLTPDEIAGIYRTHFGNTGNTMATPDFARFCLEFASAGGSIFAESLETDEDEEEAASAARIAYMQNTYSDRAYRIFERVFERVGATYYPGFREVCEEVYYGRSEYGILPVSSTTDGPLLSFRRLQTKYDLKIALQADVEVNEDTVMRFALLRKGLGTLPGTIPDLCGAWRYLDLSVTPTDTLRAGTFLSSLELLGSEILTLTATDSPALTIQLDISSADLDALYIFLEASRVRYDILGIYDILS